MSAVNEVVTANDTNTNSQQQHAAGMNAATGGRYVIDYFVIVDFAIYYRCDIIHKYEYITYQSHPSVYSAAPRGGCCSPRCVADVVLC